MSINAISSVSLYEYYYQINNTRKKTPEVSEKQGKEDVKKSENSTKEIATQENIQELSKNGNEKVETSYQDRPWADIIEQLGLNFNKNPKDDVNAIQTALAALTLGIDDDELLKDVNDLNDSVNTMYITYYSSEYDSKSVSSSLSKELDGISAINKASTF